MVIDSHIIINSFAKSFKLASNFFVMLTWKQQWEELRFFITELSHAVFQHFGLTWFCDVL